MKQMTFNDIDQEENKDDYDLIWASPPCDRFTVAAIGQYWKDGYIPKTQETVDRISLVYHTLYLINELVSAYWFLENPRGMLRNMIGGPEGTVTYCQYGEDRMKPTDLWGEHPDSFAYKNCSNGMDCHESAPRGSKTGTQGQGTSEERAKVPYELSKAVKDAVEHPQGVKIEDYEKVKG